MMKTCKEDSPLGLQITGNDVKEFEEFVRRKKLWEKFDIIDLNCGCPSTRIVGTKAGCYLLRDTEKIAAIIKILKTTGKPITVKIRLGFLKNDVLEIARAIEKAGADAITVHARLSNDAYSKKADWSWLARVKKEVKIPVIGNGDVFTGEDASKVLEVCDGVMIARGAIGDPLVFTRVLDYLNGTKDNKLATPNRGAVGDFYNNLEQFEGYLKMEKKYFGTDADFGKIKYVGGKFLRGFAGASQKRDEFMKLKGWKEIEDFVLELGNGLV